MKRAKLSKKLVIELSIYFMEVIAVLLLFKNPIILAIVLLLLSVIALKLYYNIEDLITYICAFIMGPVAELACILSGAWEYKYTTILGIPIWLPFAWGFVIMMIKRISTVIRQFILEKKSVSCHLKCDKNEYPK